MMTVRIIDHAIQLLPGSGDAVELNLGFDIVFTGNDLTEGQSGTTRFDVVCTLWDEDTFSDDRLSGDIQRIDPQSIQQVTGVNMPFVLSRAELDEEEPPGDGTVEVYGDFFLRRNGRRVGGTAGKTGTVDISF